MINIKEITPEVYESFIASHEEASPYHNKAWCEAVTTAYGFGMKYFGFMKAGELVGVLPSIIMNKPFGQKTVCSLPYCDLGGIACNDQTLVSDAESALGEYVSSLGYTLEYRKGKYEKLEDESGLKDGQKVRMLYELLDDVDAQLARFKPKLRSQIKKAMKNGVEAEVLSLPNSDQFNEFYSVFTTNMRDLGSPVHSLDWFKEIFRAYGNHAFMVLVRFEGKCVGGGIVIHTKSKAVIPWASTLRSHNKLAPNMLLYWEVLSEVIRRGITQFDFGRSGYNEGTYRFKKQWGAEPSPITWQHLEDDKLVDDIAGEKSAARAKVEKVWQTLPVSITSVVGPKIRKYISL